MTGPRCYGCGDKINAHGRAHFGGVVCSNACAMSVLVELAPILAKLGWSLGELLPDSPAHVPWDAWLAGTRLSARGKVSWRKKGS